MKHAATARKTSRPQQPYLPLLEGVSGQVSPAGGLEQRDVPPGLDVPLLLQPGQRPRSEEHLQDETPRPLVTRLQHDTKPQTQSVREQNGTLTFSSVERL